MLGKRFASPIKGKHPRAKRAKARETAKPITELSRPQSPGVSLSSSVTRREEGPSECGEGSNTPSLPVQSFDAASPSQSTAVMVSTALLARIVSRSGKQLSQSYHQQATALQDCTNPA